jgi:DNA-binding NtrC family response regulator
MESPKPLLLVVDDESSVRVLLEALGKREGFDVIACDNGREGIEVLRRRHVDLMFLDLHMPEVNGLDVLKATEEIGDSTHVALMTGLASIDSAVQAVKLGAEDYLQKPLDVPRITDTMRAVRRQFTTRATIHASEAALAEQLEFCGMVGRSAVITELFDLIRRLAPHARSVLIRGETGSGKELVARAFHRLGPRREKKFVTVNCSAIVETLFESELFGHVRGAFTGALDNKQGLFDAASGGTLFLDEVGELPGAVQGKLLRVLESGELQRVGSVDSRKVDVRVVAATNRDLEKEIAAGKFRSDLFYRLNVVEIVVPPLRDRAEDIPYLTAAFLREYSAAFNKKISGLTANAETVLAQGAWPGNVRQLRNVIERACLLCEGNLLTERDIERALGSAASAGVKPSAEAPPPVAPPTKEQVVDAMHAAGGNKVLASRRLGVSRRTLYRLIEKHELDL